jgi:hypothetical protein
MEWTRYDDQRPCSLRTNLTHDNVLYHDRGALVRFTEINLFGVHVAPAVQTQYQQAVAKV